MEYSRKRADVMKNIKMRSIVITSPREVEDFLNLLEAALNYDGKVVVDLDVEYKERAPEKPECPPLKV